MSDSIKVAIKVRPLIKRETDENLPIQWTVHGNSIAPVDSELKKRCEGGFSFDHIFDMSQGNDNLFHIIAKPIVDAAISGVNGTIFAYGQTSSGKTYTMMGADDNPGVIPLAVDYIFDAIANTYGREFLLRVSYIEIYNERINDLLDKNRTDLKVKEDVKGQVVVDCKEEVINSPAKVLAIMKKGDGNRRTGETNMNERSSRSHTIFRITIESRETNGGSEGAVNVSQLNLVDLAGSERARHTGATGERFNEGRHINMSLSALGLVIMQLSECQDTQKYVNFRDSKLTRILQASLGGNAMTTIICAITPAAVDETQCTLAFASRAKRVKNKPQVNEVLSDAALLKRYAKQMEKLRTELEKAKSADVVEMESKLMEKERANQILEERIELLKKSIVCGSTAPEGDGFNRRANRRRTWAGSGTLPSKIPPFQRNKGLPTIVELDKTPEKPKKKDPKKRRQTIIQTLDIVNQAFQTEFTDFELELIESERARCDRLSGGSSVCEEEFFVTKRPSRNVQFEDDVAEIGAFSRSADTTPERKPRNSSSGDSESPTTPKLVLRNRILFLMEEYNALCKDHRNLEEFTTLEKQMYVDDAVEKAMAEHNRIVAALEEKLSQTAISIEALKRENDSLKDDLNKSRTTKSGVVDSQTTNRSKETSSIFANDTYFDEMEVSDAPSESTSMNDTQSIGDVTARGLDESKRSKDTTNAAYSEFVKRIGEKTNDELATAVRELANAKFSLEEENGKLQTMLQRKIREADDVKNDIRELKSGIEKLHETINVLTHENTDLTSKLLAEKEQARETEKSLQITIEELNSSLNAMTDEKTLLEISSKEFDDESEIRSKNQSPNVDEFRAAIEKYKKTIASLTAENEELSSSLMTKIEELDAAKDVNSPPGDHECAYRELSKNLADRNALLESENIELSNNLMDKIEECDRVREELATVKFQLPSPKIQNETTKLVDVSINRTNIIDDEISNRENGGIPESTEATDDRESAKRTVDDLLRMSIGGECSVHRNDEKSSTDASSRSDSERDSSENAKFFGQTGSTFGRSIDELLKMSFVTDEANREIDQNDQSVDSWKTKAEMLREQVVHLTLLNEKLGELKTTTCPQCAHLAELNDNKKTLKNETKMLTRKLRELQEKFDRECADTELLRTKANEDFNVSVSDLTINSTIVFDDNNLNVSFVEKKVQSLNRELDDLRDKHDRLADLYKEKCDEIDKLQDACSRETTPTSGFNDSPRIKRTDVKLERIQSDMEKLRTDFRIFKKNITSIGNALKKFVDEKTAMQTEIDALRAERATNLSENLDVSKNDEKIFVLESELSRLEGEIRDSNAVVEELHSVKRSLEVGVERLRTEKKMVSDGNVEFEDSSNDREEMKNLKNEISRLFEDVGDASGAKNMSEDAKDSLEAEDKFPKTEICKFGDETLIDDATSERIKFLENELTRLAEEIRDTKTSKDELASAKFALEAEVEALKAEKTILEEKITNIDDATSERIKLLENELTRLAEEISDTKTSKDELASAKSALEAEVEALKAEKTVLEEKITNIDDAKSERIKFLENELTRLAEEISVTTTLKDDLASAKSALEAEVEALKAEKTILEEKITITGDATSTKEKMSFLENEVARLTDEIAIANVIKDDLTIAKCSLEAEIECLKAERDRDVVSDVVSPMEEKIVFLENEVARLKNHSASLVERHPESNPEPSMKNDDERSETTDPGCEEIPNVANVSMTQETMKYLEDEVSRLSDEINHSNEVKEGLESTKISLEAEVKFLKAEKIAFDEKITQTENTSAQERIRILETQVDSLNDEISRSNVVKEELEIAKSSLEAEVEYLKAEKASTATETATTAQERIASLETELHRLSSEIDGSSNQRSEPSISFLQSQIDALRAERQTREDYIKNLLVTLQNYRPNTEDDSTIGEIVQTYAKMNSVNNNNDLDVLKTIDSLEFRILEREKALEVYEAANTALNDRVQTVEITEVGLKTVLASLKSQVVMMHTEKRIHEQSIMELRKRVESQRATEAMLERLQGHIKALTTPNNENLRSKDRVKLTRAAKKDVIAAKMKVTNLKNQIQCSENRRSAGHVGVGQRRASIASAAKASNDSTAGQSSNRSDSESEDSSSLNLERYEIMIEDLRTKIQDITQSLHCNAADAANMTQQLAKLNETKNTLNRAKWAMASFVEDLKADRDDLESNVVGLRLNLADLQAERALLLGELESLRSEKREIVESKSLKSEKREIPESESLKSEKNRETIETDVRRYEETIESMTVKVREMTVELNKYAVENEQLAARVAELEETVKSANAENNDTTENSESAESNFGRDCITKEIKSLKPTIDDDELVDKTVSELFAIFVRTIMSKEQEIIKALSDRFDREKCKLEEQNRQSCDAEKRATIWAKELEAEIERTQQDVTVQETKCSELNKEIDRLKNLLKESAHENQSLNEKMNLLELDFNGLQAELEKHPEAKQNVTLNTTQERERLIQDAVDTREMELRAKLRLVEKQSKEKIEELTKIAESLRTKNLELTNNSEGMEANEKQLRSIADMKTNELLKSNATIDELRRELETMTKNYNALTEKHETAIRQIDEITIVMKTKCDKLSEYKTKLETITPEYEHLKDQAAERQMRLEKCKSEIECMKTNNEKEISSLKDRLDSEEIISAGLRKQLTDLTNRNTVLQAEIIALKTKCDEVERANAKLTKSMRNSTSKIRAEEEMEDLRDENRTLRRNLEGASNRIADLQDIKTQMLKEMVDLRGTYDALCSENNEMMKALSSHRETIAASFELRAKHEALLQENNRVAMELEAKKSTLSQMTKKLKDCETEIERLKTANKELDGEMDDMVVKIRELTKENADLDDKLYSMTAAVTESNAIAEAGRTRTEIVEETSMLKSEIEKLQRSVEILKVQRDAVTDELGTATKNLEILRNENSELRGRIGHSDRADSASCDSSRSGSPAFEVVKADNRRRRSRTDLFNQKRHLDVFDTERPQCCGECRCAVLQEEVCKLERDLVTKNGEIAAMEIRIQSENFPHMKRCKDLEELLSSSRRKSKALEVELQKLRELKVTELSSECDKCRHWRANKIDQSTQCLPKSAPIYLSGMSSGIVEDHIKMAKLQKDKETLKQLCRTRQKQIVELEDKIKELENSILSCVCVKPFVTQSDATDVSSLGTASKTDSTGNSRQALKENVPTIWDYQRPATHGTPKWFH